MGIWKYLFSKKTQTETANDNDINALTYTILAKSEASINQIFKDHKMELLDKDLSYIIYSVFGMNEKGPLTTEQGVIHEKINIAVRRITEVLEVNHLTASKRMATLFIIRMMMAHKLLFMMELFKNVTNQRSENMQSMRKALEKMDTLGHA